MAMIPQREIAVVRAASVLPTPLRPVVSVVICLTNSYVNYKRIHMPEKSHPVSVRLPMAVKKAAEKAAKDDTRSLSSLLEKVLTDHLRSKGYLPK